MIWQNDKSRNGPLCSSRLAPGRNRPFYLVRFPPFFQTIRNVLKRIFLLLFQNDACLSKCIRSIFQRSCSLEYHNEVWNGKANCASQIGLLAASNRSSNKLNKRTSWARPTCTKIQGFPVQRQMEEQSLQSYFPSENYQISVNSDNANESAISNFSAAQSRSEQKHVEYGSITSHLGKFKLEFLSKWMKPLGHTNYLFKTSNAKILQLKVTNCLHLLIHHDAT